MRGVEMYIIIPLILGAVAVLGHEIRKNVEKVIEGQTRIALSLGELARNLAEVRAEIATLKKQLDETQKPGNS